jgi:hypothetical protein
MSRNRRIGPRSSDKALLKQDGRTRIARLLRDCRAALIEHIGGDPNPAEKLLIEQAAVKVARLQLGSERVLENPADSDFGHWLSWSESLRRDLISLGLESRKEATPRLFDILNRDKP